MYRRRGVKKIDFLLGGGLDIFWNVQIPTWIPTPTNDYSFFYMITLGTYLATAVMSELVLRIPSRLWYKFKHKPQNGLPSNLRLIFTLSPRNPCNLISLISQTNTPLTLTWLPIIGSGVFWSPVSPWVTPKTIFRTALTRFLERRRPASSLPLKTRSAYTFYNYNNNPQQKLVTMKLAWDHRKLEI